MNFRLILLVGLLLSGCAGSKGFDRDAMRGTFSRNASAITEQAKAGKPTLSTPLRLAVYFVHKDFPAQRTMQKAEWLSTEKDTLITGLAPLRNERTVSDLFLLVDSTIQGSDAQKIRHAAARYGADAVLIVDGVGSVDRYNNGYAALYVTVIGAYFAPGTESNALFMIDSNVWDVRSELLYATQTVEGHSKAVGPAMSVEDTRVFAQARKAALDELSKQMVDQLRRLMDAPPRINDRSR